MTYLDKFVKSSRAGVPEKSTLCLLADLIRISSTSERLVEPSLAIVP